MGKARIFVQLIICQTNNMLVLVIYRISIGYSDYRSKQFLIDGRVK